MDIAHITQKLEHKETLTAEETQSLFEHMTDDVDKLKREQPEEYLKLLTMLTEATKELNKEIKDVLS
jgi:anthranilate phosphoribosyltransferase